MKILIKTWKFKNYGVNSHQMKFNFMTRERIAAGTAVRPLIRTTNYYQYNPYRDPLRSPTPVSLHFEGETVPNKQL